MKQSFQAFRFLVEPSPDAISVIDPHGQILYGSASAREVFGYGSEEIVGRNCLDLFHPDDRAQSKKALEQALNVLQPLRWDVRVCQKDGGYRWVETTAMYLQSERPSLMLHQRDIHSIRRSELEGQQREERLKRDKERIEEFAHTAAHDLRSPLHAISVYMELLMQEVKLEGQAREMAMFVVEGAARMSKVIDNLLSFAASGQTDTRQKVDLCRTVTLALDNLDLEIKKSGAIVKIDRLPMVSGNEISFVRLFQNLIGNAAKYQGKERPVIQVSAELVGADWVISVKDNGAGIAPEDQERAFMPFVRLSAHDTGGTGLGLAVCKKIVESLGGRLWVESTLGLGSTFRFTIAASGQANVAGAA